MGKGRKLMENEILLYVDGMRGRRSEQKIARAIEKMPGLEMVVVNAGNGTVNVTGGDIDLLAVVDAIESAGYRVTR